MKKPESESLIRSLDHDWATEVGFSRESGELPSYRDFRAWLLEMRPDALRFRSTMGADYDAEMWFDEELGQMWRN